MPETLWGFLFWGLITHIAIMARYHSCAPKLPYIKDALRSGQVVAFMLNTIYI